MRPPICDVCDRRAEEGEQFQLLRFADHEPLPEGTTGHPVGLHWLCPGHAPDFGELTHLTWPVALAVHGVRAQPPATVDLAWPDGDGTAGVHEEDGALLWWSRPDGPNGRFGEAAASQSRDAYRRDGPLVACPAHVEATLDHLLGRGVTR